MSGIAKSIQERGPFASSPKFREGESLEAQKRAAELQAKFGTFGVESPLGGVEVFSDEQGRPVRRFTSSEADVLRNQLIQQGLGGISADPTQAQDVFFQQQTRLLEPQFERQRENLEQSLANRGIMPGSEQHRRLTEDLANQQAGTLSDIASRALFAGQDLLGSQIANIGALTGQRDIGALPSLASATGAQFQETFSPRFGAEQQEFARKQQQTQDLIQLAAMSSGSDFRLKENLKPVGKLDNGLTVYVGNYKKETGFDTKPQLFLIAQEVNEVNPDAVSVMDNGYLGVNYEEAVKNG